MDDLIAWAMGLFAGLIFAAFLFFVLGLLVLAVVGVWSAVGWVLG